MIETTVLFSIIAVVVTHALGKSILAPPSVSSLSFPSDSSSPSSDILPPQQLTKGPNELHARDPGLLRDIVNQLKSHSYCQYSAPADSTSEYNVVAIVNLDLEVWGSDVRKEDFTRNLRAYCEEKALVEDRPNKMTILRRLESEGVYTLLIGTLDPTCLDEGLNCFKPENVKPVKCIDFDNS